MKYKTEKVIGNIEQEVRNLLIAHLFDFMSQFDMKYRQKIKYLTQHFYLSEKRIEEIVREYKPNDGGDNNE